ncbi:MAG: hypothetical protein ACT4OX_01405 [Actinomycetota bacterium]
MKAFTTFDRWLFGSEPAARLHGAITVLAAVIGARLALGPYRHLAPQPEELFDPPWFLSVLSGMPSASWIVAMQVIGTAAAVAAALGCSRRLTFTIAWAALLVLAGLRASRGKIQHNDLVLLFAAVPFLAAATDTSWNDRRSSARFGWPIRCGMLVTALAYFFSGFAKIVSSGVEWVSSDNMANILHDGARSPKSHASELARWIGDHAALSRGIALATLLFELGFILACAFPPLRRHAIGGAVVLHGAIFVLLGLDYSAWLGTVVALFVDWSRYSTVIARSGQFSAPARA